MPLANPIVGAANVAVVAISGAWNAVSGKTKAEIQMLRTNLEKAEEKASSAQQYAQTMDAEVTQLRATLVAVEQRSKEEISSIKNQLHEAKLQTARETERAEKMMIKLQTDLTALQMMMPKNGSSASGTRMKSERPTKANSQVSKMMDVDSQKGHASHESKAQESSSMPPSASEASPPPSTSPSSMPSAASQDTNATTTVQWDDGKYALVAKRFKSVGSARKYRDQLSADLHAQVVRMTPSNSPSYFAVLLPQTEKLGMDWSKWPEGTSLNDWIEVTELKKQNPQIVSNK